MVRPGLTLMLKYLGYRTLSAICGFLPRRLQYAISHRIADLHYLLDGHARRCAIANMRVVLGPVAPESKVRQEARWIFRSFGMYLCEFMGLKSRFGAEFIDEHVQVRGRENLDAALAKGRGAILCTAHYSSWELGGPIVAHMKYPITILTLMQPDARTNALFVSLREARGVKVVHTQSGARAVLKALRQNEVIAIVADRQTGGPAVGVKLFGRRASLPQGPWRIAHQSGAVMLPTFLSRRFNNDYVLEIGAPIELVDGSRDEQMAAMAQAWVECLEARVRTDPCQWAVFRPVWDDDGAMTAGPDRVAGDKKARLNGNGADVFPPEGEKEMLSNRSEETE
jgi:KDO2-lipid IV(A) lauroyltransferase